MAFDRNPPALLGRVHLLRSTLTPSAILYLVQSWRHWLSHPPPGARLQHPAPSTQTTTRTAPQTAAGKAPSLKGPSTPIERGANIRRVSGGPPTEQKRRDKLRGRFPLVVRFQQGLFVDEVNLKTGKKTFLRKARDPTRTPEKTFRVIETTSEPFKPKTFNLGIVRQLVTGRDITFRPDRTFRERRGI